MSLTMNCREQSIPHAAKMYVFGPLSDTILSSKQYLGRDQWLIWGRKSSLMLRYAVAGTSLECSRT